MCQSAFVRGISSSDFRAIFSVRVSSENQQKWKNNNLKINKRKTPTNSLLSLYRAGTRCKAEQQEPTRSQYQEAALLTPRSFQATFD
jgi:hypothetical protein